MRFLSGLKPARLTESFFVCSNVSASEVLMSRSFIKSLLNKRKLTSPMDVCDPVFSDSQPAALSARRLCTDGICMAMETPASVMTMMKSNVRSMFRNVLIVDP